MRFDEEKKKTIVLYLLEKIDQGESSVSKVVSENFHVNQSTVHTYINELLEQKIIRKLKRGQYELVDREYDYELERSRGELDTDIYAYEHCVYEHIKDFPLNIIQIWSYVVSEMINNVMDHSLAEHVRVQVEQNYLKTTVMIADDGIGIFEKIRTHFHFATADEAICELFKGKLTTDTENHSGEGIFFSSKMMDDFFIVSSGKIFTNNKYDNSRIVNIASANLKGTCVIMDLSNFSHKKAEEVFDLYVDADGGFIRTRIPLKNMFDAAPVSRSQAKRVSSRLDTFREVVVDFEGIQWMGQGFAHQLFVVYAREHPETALVPINMNEEITKMYNHVTAS